MELTASSSAEARAEYARKQKRLGKIKRLLRTLFSHLLLLPLAILFILPFYWMVSTSLKSDRQVFAWPLVWFPNPLVW